MTCSGILGKQREGSGKEVKATKRNRKICNEGRGQEKGQRLSVFVKLIPLMGRAAAAAAAATATANETRSLIK